jgi:hypothetical protein
MHSSKLAAFRPPVFLFSLIPCPLIIFTNINYFVFENAPDQDMTSSLTGSVTAFFFKMIRASTTLTPLPSS